ncbi:unnamed protein product [Rhodiola kirilowii]
MAKRTANEKGMGHPPTKRRIETAGHKRKRNIAKEVPTDNQPIVKRKQISYQTSTQTLKVGRYPARTKGINGEVDTSTANHLEKAGEKKTSKKILPNETDSDDDFVANTMSSKSKGKAKKQSAAESYISGERNTMKLRKEKNEIKK